MNTLFSLVQKIDALTTNAQQVLNALIRSCIASGSSSGYTVNKYGKDIKLTRADIYHLYDFYQSWERAGFTSDENEFNALLDKANARWGEGTTKATDAVVSHSKILYMVENDSSNNDPLYWTDKIRTASSGKSVANSAPIPLNLRTPLYDENLSTKSFSQYETYLFPIGYQRTEIMGTPGNGESYLAGGKNWNIEVTDNLTLKAKHYLIGEISNPRLRQLNFKDSSRNISFGYESYGTGNYSGAFGYRSMAPGDVAFAFGEETHALARDTFVGGGEGNVSVSPRSFTTNLFNKAAGWDSFAANSYNCTGDWSYDFTIPSLDETKMTEVPCEAAFDETTGKCIVPDIVSGAAMMGNIRTIKISSNDVLISRTSFKMKAGDGVVLYYQIRSKDGKRIMPDEVGGYEFLPFKTTVTSVTADADGGYLVTLADDIPVNDGTNETGTITGGRVSVYSRAVSRYNENGIYVSSERMELGKSGTALNHGNCVIGENQTVVGSAAVPNYYAKFIVGVGSAYIIAQTDTEHGDVDPYRRNGLLVSEHYSYMKQDYNGSSIIGVGSSSRSVPDEESVVVYDGAFMRSGMTADTLSEVRATNKFAMLNAYKGNSEHSRIGAATTANPFSSSSVPPVTAIFSSLQGTAVISSGSYIEATSGEPRSLIDTLLGLSKVVKSSDSHSVAIYANDGIEIRNTTRNDIRLENTGYISMAFAGLLLEGNTFGTLTATDSSLSHVISNSVNRGTTGRANDIPSPATIAKSGFYYTMSTAYGGSGLPTNLLGSEGGHIISSAVYDASARKYYQGGIIIPSLINSANAKTARPVVFVSEPYGTGSHQNADYTLCRALAYQDDVENAGMLSTGNISTAGLVKSNPDSNELLYYNYGTAVQPGFPAAVRKDGDWKVVDSVITSVGYANQNALRITFTGKNNNTATINVKDIVYSLVGNQLSVQFSVAYSNVAVDTLEDDKLELAFCMRIGCLPDLSRMGIGNSYMFVNSASQGSPKNGVLLGRMNYNNNNTSVTGYAYDDGTIVFVIKSPSNVGDVYEGVETLEQYQQFKLDFIASGIVPYLPAASTLGVYKGRNTDLPWDLAMRSCTSKFNYTALVDLLNIMG